MPIPTSTTRGCTLEGLSPNLRSALRLHGKQFELEDLESDVLICCETRAVLPKNGLVGGQAEVTYSAAYITPKWLAWATAPAHGPASAGSAQLRHIEMQDYATLAIFAGQPHQGLNITGRYTDVNTPGMIFISLGPEPDGLNFRHILKAALRKAAK